MKSKDHLKKTYSFLIKYMTENGYAPSTQDICNGTGVGSTSTINRHLIQLEEMGLITVRFNIPRAIKLNRYEFVKKRKKK